MMTLTYPDDGNGTYQTRMRSKQARPGEADHSSSGYERGFFWSGSSFGAWTVLDLDQRPLACEAMPDRSRAIG